MSDYSLDKKKVYALEIDIKSNCTKAKWHAPEITEMDYSETNSNVYASTDGVIGGNTPS